MRNDSEYRESGKKLKNRSLWVIIFGLLLVHCAYEGMNGKVGWINVWLSWCMGQGFKLLDREDLLCGRGDLSKRDELHHGV